MKLYLSTLLLSTLMGTQAFAPSRAGFALTRPATTTTTSAAAAAAAKPLASSTARAFGVDPSQFSDISQHVHSLQDAFTSFSLADAMDAVVDAGDVATEAAKTDNGWFGFLTGPIEGLLQLIHSVFVAVGVSGNAWGVSIIVLTILIKAATYPLTKTQLESTNKMQAMQPAIKEIQAKYQSNPEVMNQKIAEFYQVNEINPLAGCLPSLVQIPVFIGLYRAVLDLAKENKLDEPFLWLPNLEGPTYGADPASGSDWILKGWSNGVPSLGWDDTVAFLILPVLLVISQYASMQLMQPKTDDPAQQQSNAILKVLPIMIGWFSLNVPAALCVYWFTNNIITTALSVFIRNSMKVEPAVTPGGGASAATMSPPEPTIFAPPREKPAGFASRAPAAPVDDEGVKTITAIDAEIVEDREDSSSDKQEGGFDTPDPTKKRGRKKKKRKN